MDSKHRVLAVLLSACIIINLYSIVRINRLEQEISNLAQAVPSNTLNNLSQQIGSVASKLDALAREQEWLINLDYRVDYEQSCPEQIYLTMEFTLREAGDARVVLYYKEENEVQWRSVEASATGGNAFQAALVLDGGRYYQYKLQVGDIVNEVRSIPASLVRFSPVYPDVAAWHDSGSGILDLVLHQDTSGLYKIPSLITVKYYAGDQSLRTKVLYQEQESGTTDTPWLGERRLELGKDVTRVELAVQYNDGSTDEGEIWPGFGYMENIKTKDN